MRWYITGEMPVWTNGKNKEETITDFLSNLNSVRTYDFSQDEVKEILNALKHLLMFAKRNLRVRQFIANTFRITRAIFENTGSFVLQERQLVI